MIIGINEVLIHEHSGGAQQREISILPELLRQIYDHGWKSIVYVSKDLNAELLEQLIGGSPCRIVRTPLPAVPTYKRLLRGVPYWRKQVKKDNLNVFHTAYYPLPRLNIPVVFTAHDVRFMHMPETYTSGRLLFLKCCVPYTLNKASRIITVSEDTKNDIVNFWGIDPEKIEVSYNSVAPYYSPVKNVNILKKVKEKHGLPERFILCVSHLEPRKNLRRLLKAYIMLCSEHNIPHHLVILGKPIFGFESLFEEVGKSHFSAKILFTGFVEDKDMASVYSLADALVFPSLHEGFGMPAVEAMSCGVPVIASNVSALPEICGEAAELVDPYSSESIADGLLNVLNDSTKREDLIRKGFERRKRYNAEKSAAAIVQSYEKLLKKL